MNRLAGDWPPPATPLAVIGCVLPPARLALNFVSVLFFFFLAAHSWSEARSAGRTTALRTSSTPLLLFALLMRSSSTGSPCQVSPSAVPYSPVCFLMLLVFYYFYAFLGIKVVRLSVWTYKTRGRFGTDSDPVVFQRCQPVYLRSQWTQWTPICARMCVCVRIQGRTCLCVRARSLPFSLTTVASLQCIHRCTRKFVWLMVSFVSQLNHLQEKQSTAYCVDPERLFFHMKWPFHVVLLL